MLIVANWKAYVDDLARAKQLFTRAKRLATEGGRLELVIAPPAPYLGFFGRRKLSSVALGVQDISSVTLGAATGEVTAATARSLGVEYAIIGHSERRARGDTDAVVKEKLRHALAHDLTPILCVGEKERDTNGNYLAHIREQITSALRDLDARDYTRVLIAYEPLWAINKTADEAINENDLAEMVLYIRKVVAENTVAKSVTKTKVLYGGSVEPENVRDLAGGSGVDGFLVGHASVDPALFSQLIRALS
jgi:triosephosphate isomerase (TIM)